jgi:hypothetical protein
VIFEQEASQIGNLLKIEMDPIEAVMVGKVWHKVIHWDGREPAYIDDMDVHIGILREAEQNLFGHTVARPAQGLLRGEYRRFEPGMGVYPWGWLVFALRYDILEGPEVWSHDWHRTYSEQEQAETFYYQLDTWSEDL